MKTRVLITGRNGFLGSAIWNCLVSHKTNLNLYGIVRKKELSNKSRIFYCDLRKPSSLKNLLIKIKPDIIFHCAGGHTGDDRDIYQSNYETTENLFKTLLSLKNQINPRVVILGSAAEYGKGQGDRLFLEDSLSKPISWYGFVKLLQTQLSITYSQKGLDVIVVRLFNISGTSTGLGDFARKIVAIELGAKKVIQTKDLSGKRDVCDIRDLCRGLWMIAQRGRQGEIYNLCTSTAITFRDLLKKLVGYSKVSGIKIEEDKKDMSSSFHAIGSNRKILKLINWQAKISLAQSLKHTLVEARKHL